MAIMFRPLFGVVSAGMLPAILIGCSTNAPPAPPPTQVPVVLVAPPVTSKRRPVLKPVTLQWTFSSMDHLCRSYASGEGFRLEIKVSSTNPIAIEVSTSAAAAGHEQRVVHLAFSGDGGSWRVVAQRVGRHSFGSTLPLSEASLSRILAVLGGGRITISDAGSNWPTLEILPSEEGGRKWFDCSREQMSAASASTANPESAQ